MNINELLSVIEKELKQPLWNNWYLKEKIGNGAFSGVYKIEARRMSRTDVSALKIEPITVEDNVFYDDERKQSYINHKKSLVENESTIMYKLKNCPYIVTYEDEDMQELIIDGKHEGYYFLIRMEYLTCIDELIRKRKMDLTESNILKLAKDIGRGIKAAHDIGVIHRDIKPSNFFLSESGIYKLGDFNVSKQSETAKTFAGTDGYLAPEIYRAKSDIDGSYTRQADIYSFGICLYQLMNDMFFPFEENCFADEAISRRMTGEGFSKPKNASEDLSRIIMKACSFVPDDRYRTMDEMLKDLDKVRPDAKPSDDGTAAAEKTSFDQSRTVYAGDDDITDLGNEGFDPGKTVYAGDDNEIGSDQEEAVRPAKKKRGKKLLIIATALTVLVLGTISIFVGMGILKSKNKNYIYWDDNRMFFIDYSLLGQSYSSICKKLDMDLDTPQDWTWWGVDLKWTEYRDSENSTVTFMFQYDKCVMIYNDQNMPYGPDIREDIMNHYGNDSNVHIPDGNCSYTTTQLFGYSGNNNDNNTYFRQTYVSDDMIK